MKTFEPGVASEPYRPDREQVRTFINQQVIGVLSTLGADGAPHAATVAFSAVKDGNLIVGTDENSEKSHNIDRDGRVAVTITDPEKRYTLQLQAHARKLAEQAFIALYATEHYALRPESLPFKDTPGQCHILLVPTSMKFSDCSVSPWEVTRFEKDAGYNTK